jgi:hypothetical protein
MEVDLNQPKVMILLTDRLIVRASPGAETATACSPPQDQHHALPTIINAKQPSITSTDSRLRLQDAQAPWHFGHPQ